MLLGHRFYDPSVGRFLTRDPIKDGRNWYGYGGGYGNPVNSVDPDGLHWVHIIRNGAKQIKYLIFPGNKQLYAALDELGEDAKRYIVKDPRRHKGGPEHWQVRDSDGVVDPRIEEWHLTTKAQAEEAAESGAIGWEGWTPGKRQRGSPWKGILMLFIGLLLVDPVMAGEGLGEAIDGPVGECSDGYDGWTYGGTGRDSPNTTYERDLLPLVREYSDRILCQSRECECTGHLAIIGSGTWSPFRTRSGTKFGANFFGDSPECLRAFQGDRQHTGARSIRGGLYFPLI